MIELKYQAAVFFLMHKWLNDHVAGFLDNIFEVEPTLDIEKDGNTKLVNTIYDHFGKVEQLIEYDKLAGRGWELSPESPVLFRRAEQIKNYHTGQYEVRLKFDHNSKELAPPGKYGTAGPVLYFVFGGDHKYAVVPRDIVQMRNF